MNMPLWLQVVCLAKLSATPLFKGNALSKLLAKLFVNLKWIFSSSEAGFFGARCCRSKAAVLHPGQSWAWAGPAGSGVAGEEALE